MWNKLPAAWKKTVAKLEKHLPVLAQAYASARSPFAAHSAYPCSTLPGQAASPGVAEMDKDMLGKS